MRNTLAYHDIATIDCKKFYSTGPCCIITPTLTNTIFTAAAVKKAIVKTATGAIAKIGTVSAVTISVATEILLQSFFSKSKIQKLEI